MRLCSALRSRGDLLDYLTVHAGRSGCVHVGQRTDAQTGHVSGAEDGLFGAVCLLPDLDADYARAISGDGKAGITAFGRRLISPGREELSPIETGLLEGANIFRMDSMIDWLTLLVKGAQVAQAQDLTYKSGTIGPLAATHRMGGRV